QRPAERDPAVLELRQVVAGRRQVGEAEQPRRCDPDREDLGAGGERDVRVVLDERSLGWPGVGHRGRAGTVRGAHRGRTFTSSIVQGNGEQASTTSPWRSRSETKPRFDQWLMCPGVLPPSRT